MTRYNLIKQLPPNQIGFEIGTLVGQWAKEMLSTGNLSLLVLIDPWREQDPDTYKDIANVPQRIQEARYEGMMDMFKSDSRVIIFREFSRSPVVKAALIEEPPTFIYIDSNHSYQEVYADLEFYSQYAPVLYLHDYIDNGLGFGVKAAVDDWLLLNGEKWRVAAITDEDTWETIMLVRI